MRWSDLAPGMLVAVNTSRRQDSRTPLGDSTLERMLIVDVATGWRPPKSMLHHGGPFGAKFYRDDARRKVAVARYNPNRDTWSPDVVPATKVVGTWDDHLAAVAPLEAARAARRAAADGARERVAARQAAVNDVLRGARLDPADYGSGATWSGGRLSLSLEAAERLVGLSARPDAPTSGDGT